MGWPLQPTRSPVAENLNARGADRVGPTGGVTDNTSWL
jgi:hypothetical protein